MRMPRAEPTPPQYPPRLSSPKRAARPAAAVRPSPPASPPKSVSHSMIGGSGDGDGASRNDGSSTHRTQRKTRQRSTHMTDWASPHVARGARSSTRMSNSPISPKSTAAAATPPYWGHAAARTHTQPHNYTAPSPPRASPSPSSSVTTTPTRNGVAPAIDGVVRASKDALHAGLVRGTHVQRPPEQDRFDPRRDVHDNASADIRNLLVGAGMDSAGNADAERSSGIDQRGSMGAADMNQLRRELPHVAEELLQWARARAAKVGDATAVGASVGSGTETDSTERDDLVGPVGLRRRAICADGRTNLRSIDDGKRVDAASDSASVPAKISSTRLKEDMKEIKSGIKDIRVAAEAQEQLTTSLDFRIKSLTTEPRSQPGMLALIFSAEGLLLLILIGGLLYLASVLQELRSSVDGLTARCSDLGSRVEGIESSLTRLGRHLGT